MENEYQDSGLMPAETASQRGMPPAHSCSAQLLSTDENWKTRAIWHSRWFQRRWVRSGAGDVAKLPASKANGARHGLVRWQRMPGLARCCGCPSGQAQGCTCASTPCSPIKGRHCWLLAAMRRMIRRPTGRRTGRRQTSRARVFPRRVARRTRKLANRLRFFTMLRQRGARVPRIPMVAWVAWVAEGRRGRCNSKGCLSANSPDAAAPAPAARLCPLQRSRQPA